MNTTRDSLPPWASRLLLGILGALFVAGLGVGLADRETLAEHATRISVLEEQQRDVEEALEKIDDKLDRIIDCQNKQQQNRPCQ